MITEQQRKERMKGIGGSDVAAIFGLSKYKTQFELFLEKRGELDSYQEETEQQYWGNCLEPVIISEFEKRNNLKTVQKNTIIHPIYDFMRANIDAFIPGADAILEVKNTGAYMAQEWGDSGTDDIPVQYLLQVAHYCCCLNVEKAYIAVLIGGNEYRQYEYRRNFEIEKSVIDACSKFWHAVKNNIPPDPVNLNDLKLKFPKTKESKKVAATDDARSAISQLNEVKQKIKSLSTTEKEYKFKIAKIFEDGEELVDGETVLATYKMNKNGARSLRIKGE